MLIPYALTFLQTNSAVCLSDTKISETCNTIRSCHKRKAKAFLLFPSRTRSHLSLVLSGQNGPLKWWACDLWRHFDILLGCHSFLSSSYQKWVLIACPSLQQKLYALFPRIGRTEDLEYTQWGGRNRNDVVSPSFRHRYENSLVFHWVAVISTKKKAAKLNRFSAFLPKVIDFDKQSERVFLLCDVTKTYNS